METYKAVMAQIEKLKHKAEQMRQAEIKGVVERIRDAMAHYGLTADDLRLSGKAASGKSAARKAAKKTTKKKTGKKPAKVAAKPGAPKYRDPATGRTWTGRGKPPNWIVGVSDRSALLIAGGSAAAKPAAEPAGKKAKSKAKRAASTSAATEPTAQA
jgi:DNA-binding protein H-NS